MITTMIIYDYNIMIMMMMIHDDQPLLPNESFSVALCAQKPSVEENCLLLRLLTIIPFVIITITILVVIIDRVIAM